MEDISKDEPTALPISLEQVIFRGWEKLLSSAHFDLAQLAGAVPSVGLVRDRWSLFLVLSPVLDHQRPWLRMGFANNQPA